MRFPVLILLLLASSAVHTQADTITGDLDGDGLPEIAVIHNFPKPEHGEYPEEDTLAQLIVYRMVKGEWRVWEAARGPTLYAWNEAGFSRLSASIDRQTLVISHFSGGYTNIEYLHRFRWQRGRFELIGATYRQDERCTGGERFDYNLSTGDFEVEEWYDRCETEEYTEGDFEDELPLKPYFSRRGKVAERRRILLGTFVPGMGEAKLPALGIRRF